MCAAVGGGVIVQDRMLARVCYYSNTTAMTTVQPSTSQTSDPFISKNIVFSRNDATTICQYKSKSKPAFGFDFVLTLQ